MLSTIVALALNPPKSIDNLFLEFSPSTPAAASVVSKGSPPPPGESSSRNDCDDAQGGGKLERDALDSSRAVSTEVSISFASENPGAEYAIRLGLSYSCFPQPRSLYACVGFRSCF